MSYMESHKQTLKDKLLPGWFSASQNTWKKHWSILLLGTAFAIMQKQQLTMPRYKSVKSTTMVLWKLYDHNLTHSVELSWL